MLELPENDPTNPERRSTRVAAAAENAPERQTEKRTRSVSVGREDVKNDTEPYLRQQYENADGLMICQLCKSELPFKLENGKHYFESVEFITELEKRHYQNYLALCPNHSAMLRYASDSRDTMKNDFLHVGENELVVTLAGVETAIYFTKTHMFLKNR